MAYNKYKKMKLQYSYNGTYWADVEPLTYQIGDLIEENSTDCGYVEPIYKWVNDVSTNYMCYNYSKYYTQKKQVSYDGGTTWVDTGETQLGSLIEANSYDCDYGVTWETISDSFICEIPLYIYKWVQLPIDEDYICNGDCRYYVEKKQVSKDNGNTYTDVVPTEQRIGSLYGCGDSSCNGKTNTIETRLGVKIQWTQIDCSTINIVTNLKQDWVGGGAVWLTPTLNDSTYTDITYSCPSDESNVWGLERLSGIYFVDDVDDDATLYIYISNITETNIFISKISIKNKTDSTEEVLYSNSVGPCENSDGGGVVDNYSSYIVTYDGWLSGSDHEDKLVQTDGIIKSYAVTSFEEISDSSSYDINVYNPIIIGDAFPIEKDNPWPLTIRAFFEDYSHVDVFQGVESSFTNYPIEYIINNIYTPKRPYFDFFHCKLCQGFTMGNWYGLPESFKIENYCVDYHNQLYIFNTTTFNDYSKLPFFDENIKLVSLAETNEAQIDITLDNTQIEYFDTTQIYNNLQKLDNITELCINICLSNNENLQYVNFVTDEKGYNYSTYVTYYVSNCDNVTEITFKDRGTNIKDIDYLKSTFNSKLISIDFDGLDAGSSKFYHCPSLIEIKNIKSLSINMTNSSFSPYGVFEGCSSLKEFTWPEYEGYISYTDDDGYAIRNTFKDCTSLESVDLSNLKLKPTGSCTFSSLFYGCTNLKTIKFLGIADHSSTIYFTSLFTNCTSLKTLDLSNVENTDVQTSIINTIDSSILSQLTIIR